MKSFLKYSYILITILFIVCTFIEVGIYLNTYSNLLGIIYMFINYFILFLFFTITLNYSKGSRNIRISKNIMAIILGVFSSFFLGLIVPGLISYVDSSFIFNRRIYITSKIIKPILYLVLSVITLFEIKPNLLNVIHENINIHKKKVFD